MKGPLHLNPQLLSTFVAVADAGSFGAAARVIGRTEGAVSLQMRRLEDSVGDPKLFRRVGRKKEMTERGELLLAHARNMMHAQKSVLKALVDSQDLAPVRLGAPDDYSSFLPQIIGAFVKTYPRVEIELQCQPSATLIDLVQSGHLDLAIVTRQPPDTVSESLRWEPLVWVSAAGGDAHRRDSVPLATFQQGCLTRRLSLEALSGAGRPFDIVFSSPSLSGLLQPIRAGMAVGAMARCSVPDDLIIVDEECGLPLLPPLDLAMKRSTSAMLSLQAEALANVIRLVMVSIKM